MNTEILVDGVLIAIDTIVSQQIADLQFDRTTIGTIVDNSSAVNGEYRVQEGSIIYSAKSENTTYQINDQVRVSTINNAMQEKFIVGKYVSSDSTTPITYMNPLSSILQMTDNLIDSANNSAIYSIKTSGYDKEGEPSETYITLPFISFESVNTDVYDTIYVQADFKTLMSEYNMVSGRYGLLLSIGNVDNSGNFTLIKNCVFDSSKMLGNPYSFSVYTTQAMGFQLESHNTVNSIRLYLYQTGDFQHLTNTTIPKNLTTEIFNILVKNIVVGFGNNIATIADNTVKLFTADNVLTYNKTDHAATRMKKLQLAWYNKNDAGQSIGFSDGASEEEPAADDPWKLVTINNEKIKFIDELEYMDAVSHNERRNNYLNYDIPRDEQGLEIAALAQEILTSLNSLSNLLSKDMNNLINQLKTSCPSDQDLNSLFSNIETIINAQIIQNPPTQNQSEEQEVKEKNLQDTTKDIHSWIINGLNRAAKKYNTPPSLNSEEWQFKATTDASPSETNIIVESGDEISVKYYNTLVQNLIYYFDTTLKEAFYQINNEEDVFLLELLNKITEQYQGYQGIYDRYKLSIKTLFNNIMQQWNKTKEKLTQVKIKEDSDPQFLSTIILSYWQTEYSFNEWKQISLEEYNNAYCIYWYRADNNGVGDIFMPGKWTLLDTSNGEYSFKDITLNAELQTEKFKVLVFFNHVKHESNILTFENTSPFEEEILSKSSYIDIVHGQNSKEAYQNYSQTNMLINGADQYVSRQLSINYTDISTGNIDNTVLTGAQIYWYIPKAGTMLTYDLVDLSNLNNENNFTNDIASVGDDLSSTQKQGYYSFYKTINSEEDLLFSYRIKNYYVPSYTQNTIYCTIIKGDNSYSAAINMKFMSYGTSGTDYTLMISPHTNQAAIVPDNIGENPWRIDISLYDSQNEKVDFPEGSQLAVRLLDNSSNKFILDTAILIDESNQQYCTLTYNESGEGAICNILEAKLIVSTDELKDISIDSRLLNLTAYYPIAFTVDSRYFIEGASMVIYDSFGTNPNYYKNPYKLFKNGVEITNNITWELKYSPSVAEGQQTQWNKYVRPYLPTLTETNSLQPCVMWIQNGNDLWIQNDDDYNNTTYYTYIECKENGVVVWSQPILIMQNRYPSPMLNKWDGSLEINEENGTILSAMIGAGRKDTDNTFSGVLMGDVGVEAEVSNEFKRGIGLYGFNQGSQSFGFNIDGTAFIGKVGHGRIEFNGNDGTLKSSSYDNAMAGGMKIDLDDGLIHILGPQIETTKTAAEITISPRIEKTVGEQKQYTPYFQIKHESGKDLFKISQEGYYLKTANFSESNKSGVKLDLSEGLLKGYNFSLEALENSGSGIILNSSSPYLNVKSPNKSLLYVGSNDFYLQSNNFDESNQQGVKFILQSDDENEQGMLKGYNFKLQASGEEGSISINSNGDPYLKITQIKQSEATADGAIETTSADLMNVTKTTFMLQSFDGTTKINVRDGIIEAAKFQLSASDSEDDSHFITISSNLENSPFNIANNFIVAWDGSLAIGSNFEVSSNGIVEATDGIFSGTINGAKGSIGGWVIDDNILLSKSFFTESGEIDSSTTLSGIVSANGLFTLGDRISIDPIKDSLFGFPAPIRFFAGYKPTNTVAQNLGSSQFIVLDDGSLFANGAHITGTVIATDGSFSGTVEAKDGNIGDLKIDKGIKGYVDGVESFSLTPQGLIFNESSAKLQVGNFETYHDSSSSNTFWRTNGPLYIQGIQNGQVVTSMEFMTDKNGNEEPRHANLFIEGVNYNNNGSNGANIDCRLVSDNLLYTTVSKVIYYQFGWWELGFTSWEQVQSQVFVLPGETTQGQICNLKSLKNSRVNRIRFGYVEDLTHSTVHNINNEDIYQDIGQVEQTAKRETIIIKGNVVPKEDETVGYTLGDTGHYWDSIYCRTSQIDLSDEKEKNTVLPLSEIHEHIFDALHPVSYKFNINNNNRIHIGFIAQDVKKAVGDAGLTTQDFAAYCEWEKEDGTISCGLRYSEFIPLCVNEIQKLKKRVRELENSLEKKEIVI